MGWGCGVGQDGLCKWNIQKGMGVRGGSDMLAREGYSKGFRGNEVCGGLV